MLRLKEQALSLLLHGPQQPPSFLHSCESQPELLSNQLHCIRRAVLQMDNF